MSITAALKNFKLLFSSALFLGCWAQGTVWADDYDVTIYVDANTGNEAGDGMSSDTAVASYRRGFEMAVDELLAGKSTRLYLAPGVYRDGDRKYAREDTFRMLVRGGDYMQDLGEKSFLIEGADPENTVISGSDVKTMLKDGRVIDWAPETWKDEGGGLYSHEWPFQWGTMRAPFGTAPGEWGYVKPIIRRKEMLIIDGALMRQVLLEKWRDYDNQDPLYGKLGLPNYEGVYYGASILSPGEFGVAEFNEGGRIFVRLDQPMRDKRLVEVGMRNRFLELIGKNNLTLRNLTFQHAISIPGQSAVTLFACDRVVVENCRFYQNNTVGLRVGKANGLKISNSEFNWNGELGLQITDGSRDVYLAGNATNWNNWRGDLGLEYGFYRGGTKIMLTEGLSVDGHHAEDNFGPGFWTDIRVIGADFDGIVSRRNHGPGVNIEWSSDITLTRSVVEDNPIGVNLMASHDVTLEGNTIKGNSVAFTFYDDHRDAKYLSGKDAPWWPEQTGLEFIGNTVIADHRTSRLLVHVPRIYTWLDYVPSGLEQFFLFSSDAVLREVMQGARDQPGAVFRGNRWQHDSDDAPFFTEGRKPADLEAWQSGWAVGEGDTALLAAARLNPNRLLNPNFDDKLEGWESTGSIKPGGSHALYGTRVALLKERSSISQTVDVRPGASYAFLAQARYDQDAQSGYFSVQCADTAEEIVRLAIDERLEEVWQVYRSEFTVPQGCSSIRVEVRNESSGHLTVDGFAIFSGLLVE